MMVSKITEITIFESPDGERTVYVRKPGDTHRHLHSTDQGRDREKAEYQRWVKIFNARRDNPSLNDICAQAEMLYELSKDSE
jgi:hypothetical protein